MRIVLLMNTSVALSLVPITDLTDVTVEALLVPVPGMNS
jgi:hypothetical protein